jgi:hypothetical protein
VNSTTFGAFSQESDKFVGIDMDVKEILMNGYQIKAAKEFCNQGAGCIGEVMWWDGGAQYW